MGFLRFFFDKMPIGVRYIFYINVIVFLLQMLVPFINYVLPLYPMSSNHFIITQYITYQFAHGGILHIMCNMLALITILPFVEQRIGTKKFVFYYLLCGIAGALLHMSVVSDSATLVGASAAIWGMLVMFTFFRPNDPLYVFLIPIAIKSKYLIGTLFIVELFCAIIGTSDNIGHLAHVGGGIAGAILFFANKYIPIKRY